MAFNMDPKKCPMPTQDPNVRNKNFKEVALGYTAEMAVNEAKRCIHCKNKPCQTGCPVGIDIPEFIAHVAEGDFEAAYQVINRSSSLPAVCGRVCPQESQCEGKCTRGIKNEPVGIGRLERFVADWHRENVHTAPVVPASNGHKVAIIGAGPAGLTAAGDLAKLGYKVTVYEALHVAGGVLMYGIPEFRLPKAIVQQEIDGLKKMGVDFECNMVIGKVLTIDELMGEYGYEAVFVGSGAGLPRFMNIPGESLKGVYSANEFLTRSNLMKAYLPTSKTPIRTGKKVAVVGGGNVAMDAARSALRLGAETVYIVYRRGMAELPARKEEVEHAEEEGIIFKTLCNPVEILPDENGFVKAITCIEMELGEPDASGRRRPAFGGDVGLVGQSRFAEMHMVVYHARYQVQPFGIYHAVGRRKGVYGIVGRDDTQNLVVFQCDRTYEAFSFVDDGGILYSGSHNGFLYRVFFSSCFYNILFSEKMIGVFGYFFFAFPVSRFSSDLSLRSTFFTSSPGGSCSGTIPRCRSMSRTAALLSTCSFPISCCPYKSFCCTLTEVISAAKSLALILIVGKKSANGRLSGAPNFLLSNAVSIRNKALSPFERIRAKPLLSTPRS